MNPHKGNFIVAEIGFCWLNGENVTFTLNDDSIHKQFDSLLASVRPNSIKHIPWIQDKPYEFTQGELNSLSVVEKHPSIQEIPNTNPLVWTIKEELNPEVPLHSSFDNASSKQMMLNKLRDDRHFNSIAFRVKEAHHTDGRGLSWISQDDGHYLSVRMGDSESSHPTARVFHLKIQAYGQLVDKNGKFHSPEELISDRQLMQDCHISVTDWLRWPLWLAPRLPIDIRKLQENFIQQQKEIEEQQKSAAGEGFPVHEPLNVPLVTPVHEGEGFKDEGLAISPENKEPTIETFPIVERGPSVLITPTHKQTSVVFFSTGPRHVAENRNRRGTTTTTTTTVPQDLNVQEAQRRQYSRHTFVAEQPNTGFYQPREVRDTLEQRFPGQVISSTIPESTAKNVKLTGQRHPETGIVFDARGFPIFDPVAKFDTRISSAKASVENGALHKRAATKNLREAINSGKINSTAFNEQQLNCYSTRKGRNS